MTHIIEASRLYWPAFVDGVQITETARPQYGCSVLVDDVSSDIPFEFVNSYKLKERAIEQCPELVDKNLCRLRTSFKPRLTMTNGFDGLRALAKLYELAKTANISPDRLFHTIPARLVVKPVEWIEPANIGQRQAPQQMKALQIVAVRVGIGELRDNFESLLTEYFP